MVRWPALYRSHPGFFKVAAGLMALHLVMGLDHLVTGVKSPSLVALAEVAPLEVWAAGHLSIAALQGYGFYRAFRWVRVALLSSLSIFLFTAVVSLVGALQRDTSFIPAGLYAFAAGCAAAGYREPEVNLASIFPFKLYRGGPDTELTGSR